MWKIFHEHFFACFVSVHLLTLHSRLNLNINQFFILQQFGFLIYLQLLQDRVTQLEIFSTAQLET